MGEYERTVKAANTHAAEYSKQWVKLHGRTYLILARNYAAALEIVDAIEDEVADTEQMSRVIGCWAQSGA